MRNLTIRDVFLEFGLEIVMHLVDECGVAKAEYDGVKYLLIYNAQLSEIELDIDPSKLWVSVIEITMPTDSFWDDTPCGRTAMFAMTVAGQLLDDAWLSHLGNELLVLTMQQQEFDEIANELQAQVGTETQFLCTFMASIMDMLGVRQKKSEMDIFVGFDLRGIDIILKSEAIQSDEPVYDLAHRFDEFSQMLRDLMITWMTRYGFSDDVDTQICITCDPNIEVKITSRDDSMGISPLQFLVNHEKFSRSVMPPVLQSGLDLIDQTPSGYRGIDNDCKWN